MRIFLPTIVFFAIFLTLFTSVNGQKLSETELQTLITKATKKTAEYQIVFKNLTAEETKTFDAFDKTGKLQNRKKITSDLIVYEPEFKSGNLAEFHNVREVDGKKIKDGDRRAVELFAKLADVKSFAEELKKLNQESSRYDENLSFNGITLNQAMPLASNFVPSFVFEEIGRETIAGDETIIIKFQQIAANSEIQIAIKTPDSLKVSNTFYRGTIWLDLKNQRIVRLITELTLESAKFTEPFVAIRQDFLYQPSKFEIYLPQKIVVESFSPQISKSAKLLLKNSTIKPDSRLQTRLIMEYKNFSRFDVTVKSN